LFLIKINFILAISDDYSMSVGSAMSVESNASLFYTKDNLTDYSCDFKLIQTQANGIQISIHFVASSLGEKQSWCGDISQCIDNLNYSDLLQNTNSSASVNMPNKATHMYISCLNSLIYNIFNLFFQTLVTIQNCLMTKKM
jgi:hypothetical protein